MTKLSEHLQHKYDRAKILILGWGREGQSTFEVLQASCPTAELWISDQDLTKVEAWESAHQHKVQKAAYLENLSQFDVIFKTPGVPILLPQLQEYLRSGKKVTSQLAEFLEMYHAQVIGVTGTKGKSTTSSLITHLLTDLGKKVLFAGNIGTPVFTIAQQVTDDTQLVLEMSSYQLETVHTSPHVAVFLNFFPEHLNYHQTLGNYLAAKSQITLYQTSSDILVFNQDSQEVRSIAERTAAQQKPFSYQQSLNYPEIIQQVLHRLDEVRLPATIKNRNVLPALLAISHYQFNADQVLTSLHNFQPLEHRLETVGIFKDITWLDDTLATIPEATIAALETLPRVDVLLLGGYDRGIEYDKVVDACIRHHVPAIGFFQPSGQKMYDLLRQKYPEQDWPVMKLVSDMEDAVQFAYQHCPANGVVVLSPSSPSFGQFHDYRDKSAQFRMWIEKLAKV